MDTTTGVGFVGDRQGDKDVSTEIRNLLANLPQQVFSAVLHSPVFSRWNWQEKTSGTQKKTIPFPQLVPPTRYDIDTQSFYVDFTTIGLSIALEPGTRVTKLVSRRRANSKQLTNRGILQFIHKQVGWKPSPTPTASPNIEPPADEIKHDLVLPILAQLSECKQDLHYYVDSKTAKSDSNLQVFQRECRDNFVSKSEYNILLSKMKALEVRIDLLSPSSGYNDDDDDESDGENSFGRHYLS